MTDIEISGESEDKIYACKTFIQELSKVQDDYYKTLLIEVRANDNIRGYTEEMLFDYVYNEPDYEGTFEEYVASFNIKDMNEDEQKCIHCGSTKDPWWSRSIPMNYICEDCGKVFDKTDEEVEHEYI